MSRIIAGMDTASSLSTYRPAESSSAVAASSPDRSALVRQSSAADAQPRRIREPMHPLLVVRGMNGNSVSARQYREIATALADEAGGLDKLTAPTMASIRRAANMTVKLEDMTTKAVAGADVDLEQLTRFSNVLGRELQRLGIKKRVDRKMSIPEYLAARDARRAQGV
jgi:hypothetical protein